MNLLTCGAAGGVQLHYANPPGGDKQRSGFNIHIFSHAEDRREHEEHLPNFGSVDTGLTERNGLDGGEDADFGDLTEIVSLNDTGARKLQPII